MVKATRIVPEHDINDAVFVTYMYIGDRAISMNFKIPGLQGNLPMVRQSEEGLGELIVKCLRTEFGTRVEKM